VSVTYSSELVALLLLSTPQVVYRRMSPEQRRLLNAAIFEKLYVGEDEQVTVTGAQFNTPFGDLIEARDELALIRHRRQASRTASSAPGRGRGGSSIPPDGAFCWQWL
jgi:hypothetical protein